MATDWQGVVFIAVFMAVAAIGCRWVARSAVREMELLSRRLADPQCGAAGTGVEARSVDPDKAAAVLPRSHPTSAGSARDPRPVALPAGPYFPAGVVTPPAEAPAPGALLPSAALAGLQTPAGAETILSAPAGPRRRVLLLEPPADAGGVCRHTWGSCWKMDGDSHLCGQSVPCGSHVCAFCGASG
jgi:hypothetical protein